jgi:Cdc6-like AAA superfamily ATPase
VPYETSVETKEGVIRRTLALPQVTSALGSADVPEGLVVLGLRQSWGEIEREAAREVAHYERAEVALADISAAHQKHVEAQQMSVLRAALARRRLTSAMRWALLGVGVLVLWGAWAMLAFTPFGLATVGATPPWLLYVGASVLAVASLLSVPMGRRWADPNLSPQAMDAIWARAANPEMIDIDLDRARTNLDLARADVEAGLQRGAERVAASIINEARRDRDSFRWSVAETRGLSQAFDVGLEVPTRAKVQLIQLLQGMRGGAVGIAGPRGAGKSTLLSTVCAEISASSSPELQGLAFEISAPVHYETRDFLLTLFTQFCRVVAPDVPQRIRDGRVLRSHRSPISAQQILTWIHWVLVAFRPIFLATLAIGAASIVLGIGLLLLAPPGLDTGTPLSTPTARAGLPATPAAAPTVAAVGAPPPAATSASQAAPATSGSASASGWSTVARELGLTGGQVTTTGARLIFLALVALYVFPLLLRRSWRIIQELEERSEFEPDSDSWWEERGAKGADDAALRRRARELLRDLRFQQTFSSGWSGSLKLPVGLDAGLTDTMTLAQQQQSLPEIVENFKAFVRQAVAVHGMVVIAIDELDKIESDEQAIALLAALKALFGVTGCFFLVSVSESAMSSFERRGLPFRDAFDSSFDWVVNVGYMDCATTRRLLERRVIGISLPYAALCHALSGGLPRDSIRACRELIEAARRTTAPTLPVLAQELTRADIQRKVLAASLTWSNYEPTPSVAARLEALGRAADYLADGRELNTVWALLETDPAGSIDDVAPSKAEREWHELSVYTGYLRTVADVFSDRSETEVRSLMDAGVVERLAIARQRLAINPRLTYRAVESVRAELAHTGTCEPVEE